MKRKIIIETPEVSPLSLQRLLMSVNLSVKVTPMDKLRLKNSSVQNENFQITAGIINVSCFLCGVAKVRKGVPLSREDLTLFFGLINDKSREESMGLEFCRICTTQVVNLVKMKKSAIDLEKKIENVAFLIKQVLRLQNKKQFAEETFLTFSKIGPKCVEGLQCKLQCFADNSSAKSNSTKKTRIIKIDQDPLAPDPEQFSLTEEHTIETDDDPTNEAEFSIRPDPLETDDLDVEFEDVKPDIDLYQQLEEGIIDNDFASDLPSDHDEDNESLSPVKVSPSPKKKIIRRQHKSISKFKLNMNRIIKKRSRKKKINHYYVPLEESFKPPNEDASKNEEELREPRKSKVKAQQMLQTLSTSKDDTEDVGVSDEPDVDMDYEPNSAIGGTVSEGDEQEEEKECETTEGENVSRKLLYKARKKGRIFKENLSCTICSKKFKYLRALNFHTQRAHEGIDQFQCHICDRKFISENWLKCHIRKTHAKKIRTPKEREAHECPKCKKIFTSARGLGNHTKNIHENDRPLFCEVCGKKFFYSYLWKNHVEFCEAENLPPTTVYPTVNYPCNICSKKFFFEKILLKHIEVVHEGGTPFKCDLCSKTFYHEEYFKNHKDRHIEVAKLHPELEADNSFNLRCDICGKAFAHSCGVKKHKELVHEMKRDFICEKCSKPFYTFQDLRRHLIAHDRPNARVEKNPARTVPCEICGKFFSSKGVLYGHRRSVHQGVIRYSCVVCTKGFYRLPDCTKHERNIHKVDRNNYTPTGQNKNVEPAPSAKVPDVVADPKSIEEPSPALNTFLHLPEGSISLLEPLPNLPPPPNFQQQFEENLRYLENHSLDLTSQFSCR